MAASRGLHHVHEHQQDLPEGRSASEKRQFAVPLCLPNNWKWDPKTGDCFKTEERRSSLYVIEEALEQLRTIKDPVCVVSIAGRLRMGKSFLLSEAFDQPNVFLLGHEMESKTKGIWLWIVPKKYKDSNGREFRVVLLDSEGIDSAEEEGFDDHQIFTLTVLLASVLIYNSQNVPTRHDLEGLDFIAKLSQRIQMLSNSETATYRKHEKELFQKTFPFFVWLLRDSLLAIPKECENLKDYFLKRILNKGHQSSGSNQDGAGAAESIIRFFPDFDAFRLPTPATTLEGLINLTKDNSETNSSFWRDLEEFKLFLKNGGFLSPKRSFNDAEFVSGEGLAALANLYIDELNTPGSVPNVQEAWDTFVKGKCSKAKQTALEMYDEVLTSQLSDALPCDSDKIRTSHSAAFNKSREYLMAEFAGFSTETVQLHAREIKVAIEKRLNSWQTENETKTRQLCKGLIGKLKKRHLDPVLQQMRGDAGAKVSFDDIIGGYERVKGDYQKSARGSKDVISAVFFELHEELSREKDENLIWLKKLKKDEEENIKIIAANDLLERERQALAEDRKRLIQQSEEQKKQIGLLTEIQREERKRFLEQMEDERKKHQVQLQNMIEAGRNDIIEQRKAFNAEKEKLQNHYLDKQKQNQESREERKKLFDLVASKERERKEIRQQMEDQEEKYKEDFRKKIKEIEENVENRAKRLSDQVAANGNENQEIRRQMEEQIKWLEEIEKNRKRIQEIEKPGFLDFLNAVGEGAVEFIANCSVM